MAKTVDHYVTRPGRNLGDLSITIPVDEDLTSVPGIPARESDVSFFSREYPLENMALEESASAESARARLWRSGLYQQRPPLCVPEPQAGDEGRFAQRHLPGARAGLQQDPDHPQYGWRGNPLRHLF